MLRRNLVATLFAVFLSHNAIAAEKDGSSNNHNLMAGVEYKNIPQPQQVAPHTKNVVEVFGYTCPHCYKLEPSLHKWLEKKPDDIHFERMPVVFNSPNWIFMARLFYTAKEMGILEKSHNEFFHALHRDKKPFSSVESFAKFYSQFGVSEKDFIATFKSFKVDQAVRRAAKMTQAYGVEGVPALIVNGKYITDVPMAGSRDKMWTVVDTLTNK